MLFDQIGNIAAVGEEQAARTQQIAAQSEKLSELAGNLNQYAKQLI